MSSCLPSSLHMATHALAEQHSAEARKGGSSQAALTVQTCVGQARLKKHMLLNINIICSRATRIVWRNVQGQLDGHPCIHLHTLHVQHSFASAVPGA
eukprot:1157790-Pelagomonas_calceolata.AAC.6